MALVIIVLAVLFAIIYLNGSNNRVVMASRLQVQGDAIHDMTNSINNMRMELNGLDKSKDYNRYSALRREIEALETKRDCARMMMGL